jgi:hypothetical protein
MRRPSTTTAAAVSSHEDSTARMVVTRKDYLPVQRNAAAGRAASASEALT